MSSSACVTVSASMWRASRFSRKPNARVSHSIAAAASSYAMNGTMVCVMRALVRRLVPVLELVAQVAKEASGECAVDKPMVVRERQVHDRTDRDHVLAQVVLHDPRALDDRVRPEDPGLRLADHGRAVERAVAARVRDREGA